MKNFYKLALAIALVLSLSSVNFAHAEGVSTTNYFKVAGAKLNAKALTKAQVKFAKKKAKAFPNYLSVSCWIIVGTQVTKAERKSALGLAKNLCKILKAENSDLGLDMVYWQSLEDYQAKQMDLYFSIGSPRTILFNGNFSSGDLPDMPAPVGFKKKITIPGNENNMENLGLEFLGWTRLSSGAGRIFVEGDKITLKEPTTLYAKWDGYDVTMNVSNLGSENINHLGFNFISPTGNGMLSEFVDLNMSSVFEVGGYNGTQPQIRLSAPGSYDPSSLTGTGDVTVDYAGGGQCGWTLADYENCTTWLVTVTGDGSLTYSAIE